MRSTTVLSLYDAFGARDLTRLMTALAPELIGHVSRGMPCGVGGEHHGPQAMVDDVWLRVFARYDVVPVPETIAWTTDGGAVVHGFYRGTHRRSGRDGEAEFVHLLRFDESGLVCELRQVTDTASWTGAS